MFSNKHEIEYLSLNARLHEVYQGLERRQRHLAEVGGHQSGHTVEEPKKICEKYKASDYDWP